MANGATFRHSPAPRDPGPDLFGAPAIVRPDFGSPLRRVDDAPADPVDWVLPPIVARGAVTMLAGEPGIGKSLLALQWAAWAAARGERVAVVDAENGAQVIRERLARLRTPPAVYEAVGLDLLDGIRHLEGICAVGLDLLVLDSWVSLWTGSERSERAVKRCLEPLRELARRERVGILLLHHTDKAATTYRGSGAIAGALEAVFTLTRGAGPDVRLLACRKMRLGPEPPLTTYALTGDGEFRRIPSVAEATATTPTAPVSVKPRRPPTYGEVTKMVQAGLISKRRGRQLLGEPTRWWRRWR